MLIRENIRLPKLPENVVLWSIPAAITSSQLMRVACDILWMPLKFTSKRFDAIVSLTNFGPIWSEIPHILFQRNSLYFCPYFLSRVTGRLMWETLLRRQLTVASMMKSNLVVTPSDAMAEMIRNAFPQTRKKQFRTLHHGFSSDSIGNVLDKRFVDILETRRHVVKLLYPTHPGPHKGFEILFDALARLKSVNPNFCLLTTVGYEDWPSGVEMYRKQVERLGLNENVVFLGQVPQRQMGGLYKACDLMIYPSLCESFGFSMIEAFSHGLPIVAADTEVNREICGDAAIYYSSLSPDAGASAIATALKAGPYQELKAAGVLRAKAVDWSWQRYAAEFVKIVDAVGAE